MSQDLKQLDNRTVAVELAVNGRSKVCRGRAWFEDDPDLGPVLGVKVADPAGDFEFLIEAATWSGQIFPDASGWADYRLCLASECSCLN
jgi:hypothetical protein